MHQLKVFALCFTGIICVVWAGSSSSIKDVREAPKSAKSADVADIMAQCNQSFPIKPEFIHDLNTTGSFSDESEKTAMCYVHCFLSMTGVMGAENQINNEKAANMYELEDVEMVDDCNNEMLAAAISDPCGKAYFFLRCIMTRTMIDSKDGKQEAVK